MEKKRQNKQESLANKQEGKAITRKEALKRTGYIAISAATMLVLLGSPAKGQNTSQPAPLPNW
ncbi:MAG: hypothetical protein LWW85_11180 [Marinilabiliales bacterium]|nr:hypothetical protein [Marinilabiliales bacterium]